ncbi:MAG: NAD(P)/FAD-dependent oxidoreductase [Anaerolineaceae bacterium]
MSNHRVIILGAGIGGLSTAAYLANAGISSLIIERTNFPGGRCYGRYVDGDWYDIGAIYFGQRVPELLKNYFGIDINYKTMRIGIRLAGNLIPYPVDWHTLVTLKKCPISSLTLIKFLNKLTLLYRRSTFIKYPSLGSLIDALSENYLIRQLGYIAFGVTGTNPYQLPAHYLGMGTNVSGTIVGKPVNLQGGNRKLADSLTNYILEKQSRIKFQEVVEQITPQNSGGFKVITDKGEYLTEVVVSNIGFKPTVTQLTPLNLWDSAYFSTVQTFHPTLEVINIFLKISKGFAFPAGHGVFFLAEDVITEFNCLENGVFPDQSMFILQVPTNLEPDSIPYHSATIQFYHPKGKVSDIRLQEQAQRILKQGLNRLFCGLSNYVVKFTVFTPDEYERNFGFRPYVFGIKPVIGCERFSVETPIQRLYCVGDSVEPDRPSVPQAMESGILCAKKIMCELK